MKQSIAFMKAFKTLLSLVLKNSRCQAKAFMILGSSI